MRLYSGDDSFSVGWPGRHRLGAAVDGFYLLAAYAELSVSGTALQPVGKWPVSRCDLGGGFLGRHCHYYNMEKIA